MANLTRPAGLGPRDLAVAALINLMWGLNIVAVKMGVEATAPFAAGALRQLVVLLVCLPFLRIEPGRMRPLLWLGLLSGGLFLILVNLSLHVSDNVSALAIAGQLGVPFSLILAVVFLGERIAWPRLVGMALAFGGVLLLVFDPAVWRELPGVLLTAAAAFTWAVGSLIQRGLQGVAVRTIYAWIGLAGVVLLTPLSLWLEPGAVAALPALPLASFGWIAFSGIGSTVIGQGGMAWLLQRHPVSTVLPLTLASPVISVAAASWFFGTRLTPAMIAGGMVALAGVAIITIRSAAPRQGVRADG